MSGQNTSSAVMAQRASAPDALDYFPTPGWGTRALCEVVLGMKASAIGRLEGLTCWEPACGEGDMFRVLREYFRRVEGSDIYDYGQGFDRVDFLGDDGARPMRPDWIITNPPFNSAEAFVRQAMLIAEVGVAMLCRTTWLESEKREGLFNEFPLSIYAPFIGRLPMFKGRLDRKGSTATAYAWFVWIKATTGKIDTRMVRIPSYAKRLYDRDGDWAPKTIAKAGPLFA